MVFVLAGQLYTGHTACLRATSLRQYINYIVGIDGGGHVASHTHTHTHKLTHCPAIDPHYPRWALSPSTPVSVLILYAYIVQTHFQQLSANPFQCKLNMTVKGQ